MTLIKNFYLLEISDFDSWHRKTCEDICQVAKEYTRGDDDKFSGGQAQKLVNMTLKYLLLLGDEKAFEFKERLHVPVDSYIMEAASDCGIHIPNKNKNKSNCKFSSTSLPWSKWEYDDDYINFQNDIDIREKIKTYDTPMDWEHKAWIEIAKKRKNK